MSEFTGKGSTPRTPDGEKYRSNKFWDKPKKDKEECKNKKSSTKSSN